MGRCGARICSRGFVGTLVPPVTSGRPYRPCVFRWHSQGMRRNEGFLLSIIALPLAVTGIMLGGAALASKGSGGGTSTAAQAVTVPITLKEFAILPTRLTAPPGALSLKVSNTGSMDHDFQITGLGKLSTLKPGESRSLDIPVVPAGTYKIVCTVPGHAASGMTGELVVAAGAKPDDGATVPDPGGASMEPHEMDAMMDKVAKSFPAKTAGHGGDLMAPVVKADGTKEFDLTAKVVDWEVSPGKIVKAWTYNGVVPAPMIKVNVGDKVRLVLHNQLPESTSVHFHGIRVPNAMDGVDPYTQPAVKVGETFTYEFTALEPAVGIYHSHHDAQVQVPNGLFGALLIGDMPVPASLGPKNVVKEMAMVLNDAGTIGLSLNGKSFPATEPVTLNVGESMIVHYMNEGLMAHPMHLHQPVGYIIAKDGVPLSVPMPSDTINVAPGERYTVLYTALDPGVWAWHCHILNHAETPTGMTGMVTALIVT
jgi:manganese oxidase